MYEVNYNKETAVKRFCLGLNKEGSSVRIEWLPKRIRVVAGKGDDLYDKQPEILIGCQLKPYRGESKARWTIEKDTQTEIVGVIEKVNATIKELESAHKNMVRDLLDVAYMYVCSLFDREGDDLPLEETKLQYIAALKAAEALAPDLLSQVYLMSNK